MNKKILVGIVIVALILVGFVLADAGGGPLTAPEGPSASNLPDYKGSKTSLYTGNFAYSIPLMTVPGRGGLDYPLSLGYSAGITLEDESEWVGLGWNLNPDYISQSAIPYIFGAPDEFNPAEYDYSKYAAFGSTKGKISGSTFARDGVGILLNLDLEPGGINPSERIITTRDGTQYHFDEFETIGDIYSSYWHCEPGDCDIAGPFQDEMYHGGEPAPPTRFYVTKILSPDYYDTNQNGEVDDSDYGNWIKFDYNQYVYDYEIPENPAYCGFINYPVGTDFPNYVCQYSPETHPEGYTFERLRADGAYVFSHKELNDYSKSYLNTIETPTYKAVFHTSPRTDFKDRHGHSHQKLDSIVLYNKKNVIDSEPTEANPLMVNDLSNASETFGDGYVSDYGIGFKSVSGEYLYGSLHPCAPGYWYDGEESASPTRLKIHLHECHGGNDLYVPGGSTITINYTDNYPNDYRELTVFLPEIDITAAMGAEVSLYVAEDGSTYWDYSLTELAAYPTYTELVAISEVQFEYDYSLTSSADDGKLTLKKVTIAGKEGGKMPPYNFEYYNDVTEPVYSNYDWWGYYNPRIDTLSNPDQSQSVPWMWSLKEIHLPTGGEVHVEYEQDTFRNIQDDESFSSDQYGDGLRVKKTEVYDGVNAEPITTNYHYDTEGDGTGESTGVAVSVPYAQQTDSYIESDYISKYVAYEKVTQVMNNGETGKVETHFITSNDVPDERVWVGELGGIRDCWCIGGENLGCTASECFCDVQCPLDYYQSKDYFRGYVENEISYDSNGEPVKTVENKYLQENGWTRLLEKNVTLDGVKKTTGSSYTGPGGFENGLVQNSYKVNNDGTKRVTWNLYAASGFPSWSIGHLMKDKNMLSQRAGTVITDSEIYLNNAYYKEYICYNNFGTGAQEAYYPEKYLKHVAGDGNDPCDEDSWDYVPEDWIISRNNAYDVYGNLIETEDFEGNPSWREYDSLGIHPIRGWNSEIGNGKIKNIIEPPGVMSYNILISDLDQDGNPDILGDYVELYWFKNDGDYDFQKYGIISEQIYAFNVEDIDNDGNKDIVIVNSDDEVSWWENDGNQNFQKHTVDTVSWSSHETYIVDLDQDSDEDIVTCGRNIYWFENDGNQNFQKHTVEEHSAYGGDCQITDLDGDTHIDIIYSNNDGIYWYENDGNQNFQKHIINNDDYQKIMIYDIDKDDDLDIITKLGNYLDIHWFENDGNQNFQKHTLFSFGNGIWDFYLADINADEEIDIVIFQGYGFSSPDSDLVWWENDGEEQFTEHIIARSLSGAWQVVAQNMDDDDWSEIVTIDENYGLILWDWNSRSFAWQSEYDEAGNIIAQTDANGQVTSYEYDEFNRLTGVIKSGETRSDPKLRYDYFLAGVDFNPSNPNYIRTYQELEAGKVLTTTSYFDGLGKEIQTGITESANSEIKRNIIYNQEGHFSEKSKPYKDSSRGYAPLRGDVLTLLVEYKDDPLGRIDKSYPLSTEPNVYNQIFYEAKDLDLNSCADNSCYSTLRAVDEEGKETISQTNNLGQTVQVVDASNNKTSYEYDFVGNLKRVTNSESLETTYTHDLLNRLKNSTNPNTGTVEYTYDDNRNIKTKLDSEGNLVTYEYDGMARLIHINYSDGSQIDYIYDEPRDNGIGRLTSITSNLNGFTSSKSIHYDMKGRTNTVITTIDEEEYIIEYGFDSADNIIYEQLPDGTEIEYTYNNMNGLENIRANGVEKISYDYDVPVNPLLVQNITYPNSQTTFTYTNREWVESLHILGTDTEFKRFHDLDNTGNLRNEYSDLSPVSGAQIGSYEYDNIHQLTHLTDFNGYYGGNIDYYYDSVGNIQLKNDVIYEYTPGTDRLSSDGTYDYAYDARGNIVNKTLIGTAKTTRYFYDYENRLSTVILSDGSSINYYYDAEGKLAKKVDWDGTTIYIYDLDGNLVYERFIGPQ